MADPVFQKALWANDAGYRGTDVHLVRPATGSITSVSLLQYLRLQFDSGLQPAPAGATVTFAANVPNPAQFGFSVASADGKVTVNSGTPAAVIRNFLVVATVADPSNPTASKCIIRVWIHDGVNGIHLSPTPLHLRVNTSAAFAVLLDFTDKSVADVTYDPGLTWQVTAGTLTVAQSLPPPAGFRDVGFIKADSATPGDSGTVAVTLPATLGGSSSDGTVNVLPAWDQLPVTTDVPQPYLAHFIDGPGTPVRADRDVRNVLFLPEGFTKDQKALFQQIADSIAKDDLSSSAVLNPFNLVNERINYYSLWVQPEVDHGLGITELLDLSPHAESLPTTPPSSRLVGLIAPTPQEPTGPINSLQQLVYKVGIPVPTDTIASTVADQITAWNALYGPGYVAFATGVDSTAIYASWGELQDSGPVPNNDTLFGIAGCDARPQANRRPNDNFVQFHPLRYTRSTFDVLLTNVQAGITVNGVTTLVPIGAESWTDPLSKDAGLVCFLCLGGRFIGTHFSSDDKIQVAVVLTDRREAVLGTSSITPFNGEDIDIPKQTRRGKVRVPKSHAATIAHEIAHGMFCGDEYSSQVTFAPENIRTAVDGFWNLQFADELLSSDPAVALRTERIRWSWPITTKAGILDKSLEAQGSDFQATLLTGYGQQFKVGDLVRYRDPKLLLPFALDPMDPSFPPNTPPGQTVFRLKFQQPPDLFTVKNKDASNPDVLTLTLVPGALPFQNLSLPGNILYQPTQDSSGNDLLILDPTTVARMRSFGPLSRLSTTCVPAAGTSDAPQTPVNAPPNLAGAQSSSLLGLYDGGKDFRCGIFHASGNCIMRRVSFIPPETDTTQTGTTPPTRSVTRFCFVCRYLIVDQLDPRQHAVIEKARYKPKFK